MNKKTIYLPFVIIVLFILGAIFFTSNKDNKLKDNKLDDDNKIYNILGTINSNDDNLLTIINNDNEILKFENKVVKEKTGTKLSLECSGEINPSKDIQNCEIINYEVIDNSDIPEEWLDDGIFKDYYLEAFEKLNTLSIDEKIAQIMLVRYNENNIKEYQFGGYIFFEKDFKNKSKDEVINMINSLQNSYQIPLLIAADEEGGTVTRISSNKNLVSEPFKSSQELYKEGGFNAIKEDVIAKSKILSELGINLN